MKKTLKKVEVPGYPGYYLDANGNVYSQWVNKGRHGIVRGEEFKRLKCSKSKSGHLTVRFGRKEKSILVHRLMYETLKRPIPPGMLIRHLNDIPDDNRIENLAIGTQLDNMKDCIKNGHHNPNKKIKDSDIPKIKKLKETNTYTEIGLMYGVNRNTIRNTVKRACEHERNNINR